MAASTTWTQPSLSCTWVTSVRCTGFAKVSGKNDYAFIVETEWSDGKQFFVKRTFDDFQVFHARLLKSFPEFRKLERDKLCIRSGLRDLFVKDKRQLAESREQLVNVYLKNLVGLPEKVSQSALVLSFFELRSSDPKPCKSVSQSNDYSPTLCEGGSNDNDEKGENATCYVVERNDGEVSSNDDDDDYFLDVGLHELMLTDGEQSADPTTTMCPESLWCSNIDKFSTLLRTSISSIPPPPAAPAVKPAIKEVEAAAAVVEKKRLSVCLTASDEECNGEAVENSDTESQLTEQITEDPDDKADFGDELYSKSVAAAMDQERTRLYYLCTSEAT